MTSNWRAQIRRFLTAQTISLLGSSLVQYAIVWHITLTTSSGAMMTLSTLCGFLPQIAISLFAGVWVDRYNRKKLIMASDGLIAVSTLILAILFTAGYRKVWLLFAVLLIRSAGTGIQTPAVQAMVPEIVPKDGLMKVNGAVSTLTSLTTLIAPALSGLILTVANLEATLLIDVTTAAVGIAITGTLHLPAGTKAGAEQSSIADIRQGFQYLKKDGFVRRLLLFQVVMLFLISPSAFLTPLMVSRTFGAEVWRLTVSETVFSAGAVAGGLLIALWGGFRNRMRTTLAAGLAYGVLMLGLGLAPSFGLYLAFNCLIGITMPCYNAPIIASLQERVPPRMQGRVFGFMQIVTASALPLGMVLFGPLADAVSVQILLILCGVIASLTALASLLLKMLEPR
ncbi:MFS transporter [Gehongia tenuis]|uniref:MFS transporter n=1 Tax=Gehongia tenuis TaxID=2763655 RepID=A0A926D5V7_9FIRM|nr:MFS transporter [Gehongia tenuis]MBC8531943.1 MFS transporter [Gehongia tenuis]